MNNDVEKVLINEEEIAACVQKLADQINKDYQGKEILALIILKGSSVFAADLIRKINVPVHIDFMQVSSYGAGTTSGTLKIKKDLESDCTGKHILVIEDIVDSGNTLYMLKEHLSNTAAASVKICTLLSKPARRESDVEIEYIGDIIPDEFIVGYGLDYAEKYRNLPYIGILKREGYE